MCCCFLRRCTLDHGPTLPSSRLLSLIAMLVLAKAGRNLDCTLQESITRFYTTPFRRTSPSSYPPAGSRNELCPSLPSSA
ncbi:hypothetical protein PsYK624_132170 [Phanerochaete sordida]|uniref:Secreted protein n=1 Tax=Phanerochaete sordida TaxID=48140 RepID=A0A9P3GKM3_9APHY|nr:hypothetical protein PsYK624_132170 [Phanerochaete sordida]